jgi:hypothetical protein
MPQGHERAVNQLCFRIEVAGIISVDRLIGFILLVLHKQSEDDDAQGALPGPNYAHAGMARAAFWVCVRLCTSGKANDRRQIANTRDVLVHCPNIHNA